MYVNLTGDTHPMHTHLVTFQVVGRTPFDADAYQAAYGGLYGVPGGNRSDTVRDRADGAAGPDGARVQGHRQGQPRIFHDRARQVRPADRCDAPQTYVYHCHIVEHEDNDMMRPFTVIP